MSTRQRVFIPDSEHTMNFRHIGNALQAHTDLDKCSSADSVLTTMQRYGMANSAYPQNLGKWQSAVFMHYSTKGKAGFGTLHLLEDDVLLAYCRAKDANEEKVGQIVRIMSAHPDKARAKTWKVHGETFRTVSQKDAEIAKLMAELESLKADKKATKVKA